VAPLSFFDEFFFVEDIVTMFFPCLGSAFFTKSLNATYSDTINPKRMGLKME